MTSPPRQALVTEATQGTPLQWAVPKVRVALIGIACAAFLLRALTLLRPDSFFDGFDAGIYFTSAGLFAKGYAPYRDFAFVHPPGIMVLLSPFVGISHWTGLDDAFVAARWCAAFIGGINTMLVGTLALRWRGPAAALVAAGLYATFPPALAIESNVMLEPFLNLAGLVAAWVLLSGGDRPLSRSRLVASGALFGLVPFVKLYGACLLVPALVGPRFARPVRDRLILVASALVSLGLACAPFALRSGVVPFVRQVFVFQLLRPASDPRDGALAGTGNRADNMLDWGQFAHTHAPATAAVVALGLVLCVAVRYAVRGGAPGRYWGVQTALIAVLLLASHVYYDQYSVFLLPALSVLAAAALVDLAAPAFRKRRLSPALVAAVAVAGFAAIAIEDVRAVVDTPHTAVGASAIRRSVPKDARFWADPPAVGIAIDRLPPSDRRGRVIADPFGEPLYRALESGQAYGSQQEAFATTAAQARLRAQLAASDYVALAPGFVRYQWTEATRTWFALRFVNLIPDRAGRPGLWRARQVGRRRSRRTRSGSAPRPAGAPGA